MKHVRGWSRSWSACILLILLVGAGVATTSCGRSGSPLDPQASLTSSGVVLSAADSVPKPPKPPKPPDVTAQFAGAETTPADSTGISRWLLGNNGPKPLVMNWTVTGDSSWSAFPIQGSITVGRRSSASLEVPIPVPPGTPAGSYPLLLTVQNSAGSASAAGAITVPGDSVSAR
jgi:hypothetical protein